MGSHSSQYDETFMGQNSCKTGQKVQSSVFCGKLAVTATNVLSPANCSKLMVLTSMWIWIIIANLLTDISTMEFRQCEHNSLIMKYVLCLMLIVSARLYGAISRWHTTAVLLSISIDNKVLCSAIGQWLCQQTAAQ